ncbi:hypothetical protein ACIBCT_33790 [Streptosporangium sp. NPDC050855]|uniref:hypothetical protein n=1 Tax=Streptosporangium sp. NPDC050855 TaxID=3366194 RepID=UPI0037A40505
MIVGYAQVPAMERDTGHRIGAPIRVGADRAVPARRSRDAGGKSVSAAHRLTAHGRLGRAVTGRPA